MWSFPRVVVEWQNGCSSWPKGVGPSSTFQPGLACRSLIFQWRWTRHDSKLVVLTRWTLLPGPARTSGPVQPKKIRALEKKLGRNHEIWNWATDFLGRNYFYRAVFESCGPVFSHLATVTVKELPGYPVPEPVFSNVYGAPELIPRNEFRQPM
jgi:hypothetical protein